MLYQNFCQWSVLTRSGQGKLCACTAVLHLFPSQGHCCCSVQLLSCLLGTHLGSVEVLGEVYCEENYAWFLVPTSLYDTHKKKGDSEPHYEPPVQPNFAHFFSFCVPSKRGQPKDTHESLQCPTSWPRGIPRSSPSLRALTCATPHTVPNGSLQRSPRFCRHHVHATRERVVELCGAVDTQTGSPRFLFYDEAHGGGRRSDLRGIPTVDYGSLGGWAPNRSGRVVQFPGWV